MTSPSKTLLVKLGGSARRAGDAAEQVSHLLPPLAGPGGDAQSLDLLRSLSCHLGLRAAGEILD